MNRAYARPASYSDDEADAAEGGGKSGSKRKSVMKRGQYSINDAPFALLRDCLNEEMANAIVAARKKKPFLSVGDCVSRIRKLGRTKLLKLEDWNVTIPRQVRFFTVFHCVLLYFPLIFTYFHCFSLTQAPGRKRKDYKAANQCVNQAPNKTAGGPLARGGKAVSPSKAAAAAAGPKRRTWGQLENEDSSIEKEDSSIENEDSSLER